MQPPSGHFRGLRQADAHDDLVARGSGTTKKSRTSSDCRKRDTRDAPVFWFRGNEDGEQSCSSHCCRRPRPSFPSPKSVDLRASVHCRASTGRACRSCTTGEERRVSWQGSVGFHRRDRHDLGGHSVTVLIDDSFDQEKEHACTQPPHPEWAPNQRRRPSVGCRPITPSHADRRSSSSHHGSEVQ
nr:hypothetical protein CFP56_03988 [Quercus suber]